LTSAGYGKAIFLGDKLRRAIILVVEDIEETRDAMEQLLAASRFLVMSARNEGDAVLRASQQRPDLILMSPGDATGEMIAAGVRIRSGAGLGDFVPIVIFCCPSVAQGAVMKLENSVYLARPDDFDQLRELLRRLCLASKNRKV
jgi:DNA-binding response OmpR family regulator